MGITGKTVMTDRQLLVHLVEHVEEIHDLVRAQAELIERFRPLLDRLGNGQGSPWVGMGRAGREPRRGRGRT